MISMDFLAQLRGYYINRSRFATFQSVILAGVCDIRNLKRKMRPEEEHKDNSPWNIAADFDIDMSFSTEEINDMLLDYASEQELEMDTKLIAREIHDYTSGYLHILYLEFASCLMKCIKQECMMRGVIQDFWRWFGNWFASQ